MRVFATALALACAAADPVGPTLPWGIHIASGSEPQSSMTIMWSTRAHVAASVVTYNPAGGAPLSASGEQWLFSDVGNTQTLHRVLLENLLPGTKMQPTFCDGNNHLPTHNLALVMGITVILSGSVVLVAA